MQILLCCARTRLKTGDSDRLHALLQHDLDWNTVLRLAGHHRLLPLLNRYLDAAPPGTVPPPVLSALRASGHAGRLREHLLTEELLSLLALLAAQGIPALPYKGPAFAGQIYGDTALRPCSDLDLLVPPEAVLRVKELLLARGYLSQQRFADAAEEAAHLRTDCEYNFSRPGDRLLVEIHWRFRPQSFPLPLDVETLWERRQTGLLGGVSVPVLALDDTLLLLCIHGAKHCWERLLWVCDIAEIVQTDPGLPWERIAAQAERLGCRRVLLLGLLLARDLLDAPVPDAVLQDIPTLVRRLAAQVGKALSEPETTSSSALARSLFHIGVRERLGDQVPYVRDRIRRETNQIRQRVFRRLFLSEPTQAERR